MELPANLIESSITRGTILHSTIFEEIDHGKYFVIIGVSEEQIAGFFFINSIYTQASNQNLSNFQCNTL